MSLLKKYFAGKTRQTNELDSSEPLLASYREARSAKRWKDTDGLHGWLIALAIFLMNFVILGHGRASSILYVDFMEIFHVNRRTASQPYSIQQSVRMFCGPVVGIIGQTFGMTVVAVIGCVIAAISCAATFFSDGIKWITISWGGLFGIGAAFTSTINLVLIEQYFVRYRSSASGFAFSGACAGAFFFPVILDILIHKYGIRGTLLIMGGILMNVIPIALLLREKQKSGKGSDDDENNLKSRSNQKTYNSFDEHETSLDDGPKNNSALEDEETVAAAPKYDLFTDPNSKEETDPKSFKSLKVRAEVNVPSLKSSPIKSETIEQNVAASGKIAIESETGAIPKVAVKGQALHPDPKRIESNENGFKLSGAVYNSKENLEDILLCQKDISDADNKPGTDFTILEESKQSKSTIIAEDYKLESKKPVAELVEKTTEKVVYSKTSGNQKRIIRPDVYRIESYKSNAGASYAETKSSSSFGHEIKFDFLHENTDMVLDLLTNKIPIGDEEMMPSSNEITQNDLESPDVEFISQELQRIESELEKPLEEVQQFLNTIRDKLRNFQQQLDSDRGHFLQQKKLNIDGKELKYKDIRNTTIRRSSCTIEIFEYTCEIPVELYIPIKLQELYERSSSHILTYYNNNELISRVLRELRKLHELLSGEKYGYAKDKRPSHLLESTTFSGVTKSSVAAKQTERPLNTFCGHVVTAFKIQFNPVFFLICLCRCLHVLTFIPVIMTVVDFAIDKGMTKSQGIYAIIALSGGDLLGRLCAGWISDKKYISDTTYMVIILILQGAATALLPRAKGIVVILPMLLLFAICQGLIFVKHPVILMKYLKKHEKSIGLGCLNFFPGIIGLFIPYYIGYTRDILGSYDMMYFINGGLSVFVGLLWLLEPYLRRFAPEPEDPEDH